LTIPIANSWFSRRSIDADTTLLWEPHVDPLIRCNIWHIRGRDSDLLVDTGTGISSLKDAARNLFSHDLSVVATHFHYDHTGGVHEFDSCYAHSLEADLIRHADKQNIVGLRKCDLPKQWADSVESFGYSIPETLVTAIPCEGYEIGQYKLHPAKSLTEVDDGDRIDLGDRSYSVIHLPGHSPGSIGLWDEINGVLFTGDALYDGQLLANLPESNIADYIDTLERLLDLPVNVVHCGHQDSFGRERLRSLVLEHLDAWRA